ncbi:MAG: LrgB family protein [Pseudomonadota bacterium]|nr:LrgB family protein [Pseudomonadota bacterium]
MLRAQLAVNQITSRFAEVVSSTVTLNGMVWLAITLAFYGVAIKIFRASKGHPLVHPLSITTIAVAAVMWLCNVSAAGYREYASLLHWLLGPATVALAVPMYNQWQNIRQLGAPLIISVMVGGALAPLLAWAVIYLTNAPMAIQMTMLVKSITSPLAMETGAAIGGIPALAAVFVILTGIVGALAAPLTYRLLNVTMPDAQGVALGAVCHAVGTSKALQMGEVQGALATVGLGLNGILTAVVLPVIL